MKGTIAILGCLFAAYAAPLFANEVPLILDETIQLPVVPDVWDVAKTGDSEFTWVVGEGTICNSCSVDSLSKYYVGTSTIGVIDTFVAGPYGGRGVGWPRYVEIFKSVDTTIQCVVMSSYIEGCTSGGESNIQRYNISTQRRMANVLRRSFCDRPPNFPDARCWCNYQFSSLAVVPSYPYFAQSITATQSYYTTEADDHSQSGIYIDVFDTGGAAWIDANVLIGTFSQWAFQPYYAVVDDGSDICTSGWIPEYCPIVKKYVIEDGSAILTSSWPSIEQTPQECLELLCTWDEELQSALVILRSPDSLKAWTDQTDLTRWRYGSTYREALLADAVQNVTGEELLLAEPQFELLHIRNPRDYSFWGQTSSFGTGYDEIKIVSRYDSDFRRLVVRYGSELRIYRFGEPIYTDTDDVRPELPNELTLMSYPNPFNPTTMIAFDLPKAERANLSVYDLNGRLVKSLVDEQMTAGHHELGFDGANLPSGIYFARLNAGDLVKTQKLVLLK